MRDGRFINRFIEGNFSKFTHSNQIFKNDFVCNHYHLSKIQLNYRVQNFPPSCALLYVNLL